MTVVHSWGLGPYGITPWGSTPSGTGVSLESAIAISTHEVRVMLTAEPLHISSSIVGDALCPATWMVQRLDTLAVFNVVSVNIYTPLVYGLVVLQPFGSTAVDHEVSSMTLLDAGGNLLIPPRNAQFFGILAAATKDVDAELVSRRVSVVDIANPQFPVVARSSSGGTLVIDDTGDYEPVSGPELIRKLIIRRLLTIPGEFYHLPEYGVGLPVKEPVPAGDLVLLKSKIKQQVLREPEVEDVGVGLTLESNGVLSVNVKARMRTTGQDVSIGLKVSQETTAIT